MIRKIKNMYYEIVYFLQRLFTKNHISDDQIWDLYVFLAKDITKALQAFRKAKRWGTPLSFTDWEEGSFHVANKTKEEWYAKNPGGGLENWNKYIDEMIFAFDYCLCDLPVYDEKDKWFYDKYGITDPFFETRESVICSADFEYTVISDEVNEQLYERYKNGIRYFAEYFHSLRD